MSGLPVARLFGIEIRLALSWVFVIAIVTVTIGGQLRAIQPEAPELLAWVIGGMASLGFLVATVAHELAHALVARRVGMDVPVISVHFIGGPAVVDVRPQALDERVDGDRPAGLEREPPQQVDVLPRAPVLVADELPVRGADAQRTQHPDLDPVRRRTGRDVGRVHSGRLRRRRHMADSQSPAIRDVPVSRCLGAYSGPIQRVRTWALPSHP